MLLVQVENLYITYSNGWGAGRVHVDFHHKNKGMGVGEYCVEFVIRYFWGTFFVNEELQFLVCKLPFVARLSLSVLCHQLCNCICFI